MKISCIPFMSNKYRHYNLPIIHAEFNYYKNMKMTNFTRTIINVGEAMFTCNGINNCQNMHVWSIENPQAISSTKFQKYFSVSGLVDDILIGPHILPDPLTDKNYVNLLKKDFPFLLSKN